MAVFQTLREKTGSDRQPQRNISQPPVLCVRCKLLKRLHGAPADSIFSRFNSLEIVRVQAM